MSGTVLREIRAAGRKLNCLNPSLRKVPTRRPPERHLITGADPSRRVFTDLRESSGVLERCPVRVFKETNGTPKPR